MYSRRIVQKIAPAAMLLAVGAMSLEGCASGSAMNPFTSYNVASDDDCGQYRTQLKGYQSYFFASMMEGAAMGAVLGGLAGYAIGGNATGALVGAGTGAVIGGVGGYYAAKAKANSSPGALTASVYSDLSNENRQIDGVSGTFRNLKDCRIRSAAQVKRDYRAKRIDQQTAAAKLTKEKEWMLEDISFAESLGAKMNDRGAEYANASDQINKAGGGGGSAPPPQAPSGGGGGSGIVAREAARVRSEPSTTAAQVTSLSPGEGVTVIDENTPEWTHIRLRDGREGFVASRLLGSPSSVRTASSGPPPAQNASGVQQLTQSNQLKRKALGDDVTEAKTAANGNTFELSGGISRIPPSFRGLWQA
jgi:hypothetical protein